MGRNGRFVQRSAPNGNIRLKKIENETIMALEFWQSVHDLKNMELRKGFDCWIDTQDLPLWTLQEEDDSQPSDWMPLIAHCDPVKKRWNIFYCNVNKDSIHWGRCKHHKIEIGKSEGIHLEDVPRQEELNRYEIVANEALKAQGAVVNKAYLYQE
jgi:hypothetical protein